jgi:hypothetical protein
LNLSSSLVKTNRMSSPLIKSCHSFRKIFSSLAV